MNLMKYIEKAYSDIETIDKKGIIFKSGDRITFTECIRKRYNSDTCVAERDYAASPPYFEFFTQDLPVRVVFNKKGLFSKSKNNKEFLELQLKLNDMGYSSYDLSW